MQAQDILHFWFDELTDKQLFSQSGLEDGLNFELRHKAIVDRFGRFAHRNAVLGRASSAEETAF